MVQRALTSPGERIEAALEDRLTAAGTITRCATVAVASSKGGVGKTTCAFVAGTLLADRSRLRILVIDADGGTLPRLLAERLRSARSAADLVQHLDTIESAAQLRAFVSVDRSGLHVLAGPVHESVFGAVLHLCERFYEVVLIDLGAGLTNRLAHTALQRAHHIVMVTTPESTTAASLVQSVAARSEEAMSCAALTVVFNRVTEDGEQLAVARTALEKVAAVAHTTSLPQDPQLARMLDTGTFGLGALARPTRLGARHLAVAVLEHLR